MQEKSLNLISNVEFNERAWEKMSVLIYSVSSERLVRARLIGYLTPVNLLYLEYHVSFHLAQIREIANRLWNPTHGKISECIKREQKVEKHCINLQYISVMEEIFLTEVSGARWLLASQYCPGLRENYYVTFSHTLALHFNIKVRMNNNDGFLQIDFTSW